VDGEATHGKGETLKLFSRQNLRFAGYLHIRKGRLMCKGADIEEANLIMCQ